MTRTGRRQEVHRGGAFAITPPAKPAVIHEPLTPVVFKGTGGYIVAGPESHQVYCFSSNDPQQMVDTRDTEALLKTGLFRIKN